MSPSSITSFSFRALFGAQRYLLRRARPSPLFPMLYHLREDLLEPSFSVSSSPSPFPSEDLSRSVAEMSKRRGRGAAVGGRKARYACPKGPGSAAAPRPRRSWSVRHPAVPSRIPALPIPRPTRRLARISITDSFPRKPCDRRCYQAKRKRVKAALLLRSGTEDAVSRPVEITGSVYRIPGKLGQIEISEAGL